jgi:hypothetical protein
MSSNVRILRLSSRPEGSPSHQNDGFVAGLLQPMQQQDLHKMAHMEGGRGTIESDIGCDVFLGSKRIKTSNIRALVDEASGREDVKEIGSECCHGAPLINTGASRVKTCISTRQSNRLDERHIARWYRRGTS